MVYADFDWNALKVFISVYENKGINHASKKLFLTQPAVSAAIKKLEHQLGGNLFTRLPKGVVPTAEGERFYNYIKQAERQIELGLQNFSDKSALLSGKLTIGANTAIIQHVLMPFINQFCKKHPNIKISFTEVISSRLQRYLANGEIDIAFMEEPILDIKQFTSKRIMALTNCFVAGATNAINKVLISEVEKNNWAVLKPNTNGRSMFEVVCKTNTVMPNIAFEMASYETLEQVCEHRDVVGFGVKEFLIKGLESARLKCIETDVELSSNALHALTPKGNSNGFVCQAFLDFFV